MGEPSSDRRQLTAEFWPCPDCRTPAVVVNGALKGDGLQVEFHDRLTPSGVAPNRITLHDAICTTRGHLNVAEVSRG